MSDSSVLSSDKGSSKRSVASSARSDQENSISYLTATTTKAYRSSGSSSPILERTVATSTRLDATVLTVLKKEQINEQKDKGRIEEPT